MSSDHKSNIKISYTISVQLLKLKLHIFVSRLSDYSDIHSLGYIVDFMEYPGKMMHKISSYKPFVQK